MPMFLLLLRNAAWLACCLPLWVAAQHTPERLGPAINTEAKELLPRISPDGRTLYFVRMGGPDDKPPIDQDIWKSERGPDGSWQPAEKLPFPINNVRDNAVFGLTPDGNTLLLLNSYERDRNLNKGLAIARRQDDGTWSKPTNPVFAPHERRSASTSYFLANDGQTLLMEFEGKDSNGFQDLYVSFLDWETGWGTPKNLGSIINTMEYEVTPFLASDMRTLYFASSGHGGEGSLDIFVSTRLDDTWQNWTPPRNLGPPINTEGYDAYFSLSARGDTAYFGSTAGGADQDIYRVALPPELRPKPVQLVSGRVLDAPDGKPIPAAIRYTDLQSGIILGVARTDPTTGRYQIALPAGADYDLFAKSEGFASRHTRLDLRSDSAYREVERDLFLTAIAEGNELPLHNLFFGTGSADIEPASQSELRTLLELLTDRPSLRIELGGHTDNTGGSERNLALSQERAEAVRQWLIEKGIAAERIEAKGYGDTQPTTANDTEAGRAQNRRVVCRLLTDGK